MNSFTHSHSKQRSASNLSYEKQSTLWDKMAECWLRQNNQQYQQLLIDTKELQLTLIKEEALNKNIMKSFNQKKKDIQELQNQLQKITKQTLSKKIYLDQYYKYLNDKLKSGTVSINLNMKLDTLSKSLNDKLQNQRTSLQEIVTKKKYQLSQLQQELTTLQNRKQNLSQNLRNLKKEKEIHLHQSQVKKAFEKARKIAEKQEYQQLQKQIQSLQNEKEHLQKNQSVLKTLLNIEDVHKKCWSSIEMAIKTEFMVKVFEIYQKQTVQMEYKLKLPQLQAEVGKNKHELNSLNDNLNEQQLKNNILDKKLQDLQIKSSQLNKQLSTKFQKKATI